MMKSNFIIYKVKNEKNDKVYIGATTSTVKKRKLSHEQKSSYNSLNKFQKAISTYGADAFQWKQIDTANSIDELAQKEKEYILKFSSKENGYNSDSGGGFKKTVYQYDLNDGSLIEKHDCLESAGNLINATKQQISRACLSVSNKYGGFYWSYDYKEPFKPELDRRVKSVIQLDNDNVELGRFSSVSEASEITGCNKTSIAKVCRGERNYAGGFKWCYK